MSREQLGAVSAWPGDIERGAAGGFKAVPVDSRTIVHLAATPGATAVLRERLGAGTGIELPERAAWRHARGLTLACIGPGRWLAMADDLPDAVLERELGAMAGDAASLVDVSDAYAVIRLSGPWAPDVLSRLVPVDLHPSAMAPGAVAVTHADHVAATLLKRDAAPTFDLMVPRTYAGSVHGWLEAAAEAACGEA